MKNWDSSLAITWRSWSKSAIECYQRGCNCYECPTQALFAEKCRMKEAVLSLVRQFGEPPKNIEGVLPDLTEGQIEVINAIVNGANTFEDIAEVIGITILGVKSRLNKVYEAAKLQGFEPEHKRYMLPELTIFLRELAKQYVPPEEPPKIIYCNPEYISPITVRVRKDRIMSIDYELLQEMIDCVKREVSFRYAVYPKRVRMGKMTEAEKQKEIHLMYGVQKTLQKIYDGQAPEEVQKALFDMTDFKAEQKTQKQWYEV